MHGPHDKLPDGALQRAGVLYKRSDFLKDWQPRHFKLEGFYLRYALPDSPLTVKKALDLALCKITRCDAPVRSRGAQNFHLLVVTKIGAGIEWTLGALHAREADEWVLALKAAAGKATRRVVKGVQDERRAELCKGVQDERRAELCCAPSTESLPTAAPASTLKTEGPRRRALARKKRPSVAPAPTTAVDMVAKVAPALSNTHLKPGAACLPSPQSKRRHFVILGFLAPSVIYIACGAHPGIQPLRGAIFFASLLAVGVKSSFLSAATS